MVDYPLWYFHNRYASDKKFIFDRLSVIPKKYRRRASDRYEKLFKATIRFEKTELGARKFTGKGDRKTANTYIHKVAKRFKYLNERPIKRKFHGKAK